MQSSPDALYRLGSAKPSRRKPGAGVTYAAVPLVPSGQADYVRPFSRGGDGAVSNYQPCCKTCNRARWHYRSKKIRNILRYGVFGYSQVLQRTALGRELRRQYRAHRTKTKARRVIRQPRWCSRQCGRRASYFSGVFTRLNVDAAPHVVIGRGQKCCCAWCGPLHRCDLRVSASDLDRLAKRTMTAGKEGK